MRCHLPGYTRFESFRDSDTAPYYRSELRRLSPEETWTAINARLHGLLRGIHQRTRRGPVEIDPELLHRWHRHLFGRDFAGAGRIRAGNVYYPVVLAEGCATRERQQRGSPPDRVREDLEAACRSFAGHMRTAVSNGRDVDVASAARAAAALYAELLRIHPYPDGNGRVAFAVLQAVVPLAELIVARGQAAAARGGAA